MIAPALPARQHIAAVVSRLPRGDYSTPYLDARILIGLSLGYDRPIYAHEEFAIDEAAERRLDALVARRQGGEPVSRLRGWREFYDLRFELSAATLDPRPDSETLVDVALSWLSAKRHPEPFILDYGTGCGCLMLAILSQYPEARGVGLDFASDAVRVARRNTEKLGLEERVEMIASYWCDGLAQKVQADLVVTNPPYIPCDVIPSLMPEVREYDPKLALDGGADGLAAWREIMPRIKRRLAPEGAVVVEIGKGQEKQVTALAAKHGLQRQTQHADSAGVIRVLVFFHSKKKYI